MIGGRLMLQNIRNYLAIAILILVLLIAVIIIGYREVNITTGQTFDFFGRELIPAPLWARMLITSEYQWAGFSWFIFDMIAFWSALFFSFILYKFKD